jgi:hypothetical protein
MNGGWADEGIDVSGHPPADFFADMGNAAAHLPIFCIKSE